MFEFYRVVTNPDTNKKELKKLQYEETAETLPLKEKLEKEAGSYEVYEVTYVDTYYHCNRVENTYSVSLSNSVFNDNDEFIGYMMSGIFYLENEEQVPLYREVRGATSVTSDQGIRRKR